MARTSIYLNFSRNTEEVFRFYQTVFGGEFIGGIQRMRDIPKVNDQPQISGSDLDLIVHIELAITGGQVLMGTDAPETMGFRLKQGNNVHINLEPDTRKEAERLFNALSAGGQVMMHLQEMFWGAYFGSCVDKYGTSWMVNCDEKKTMQKQFSLNPELDLVFERQSTLSVEQLWQGWTHPETLMKWFCPRPWKVTSCRTDLYPGGEFYTLMQGPNGEQQEGSGCYLEVVPFKKLVWTNMMSRGYRPTPVEAMGFSFVGTIEFERKENGSLYRATIQHGTTEGRLQHERMGFQEGWGIAFHQLMELFGAQGSAKNSDH